MDVEMMTLVNDGGGTNERPTSRPYPEGLIESFTLTDGRTLTLRPIQADDEEKLDDFHRHLSPDSIYRRYFSFHGELSRKELSHLTHVDYDTRLALVMEDGHDLVGVARYDRYPNTSAAEVAFVVRDDYQHLGLGHHLFARLAAAAWARGVTTFSAETLCRNHDMMSVFRHGGFPMTSSVSAGEVSVRISIDPCGADAASTTNPTTSLDSPWS